MEIVTDAPIDPKEAYGLLQKESSGSVVLHYAVVRGKTGDKTTTAIEFRRGGDTEAELREISTYIRGRWRVEDVLIIRRMGLLKVGDIISLVAASSPQREGAFESCMYGIEKLKKMKTIKKNEIFS